MCFRAGSRQSAVGLLVLVAAVLAGCEDKVVVETGPEALGNRPPAILLQDPEFSSETIWTTSRCGVSVRVLPVDPDGADDILAVLLNIDSIAVHQIIVRPAVDPDAPCVSVSYADNDTVDIVPWIPPALPGARNVSLRISESGYYGVCMPFPDFEAIGEVFGPPEHHCWAGDGGFLDSFAMFPPALPSPADVFLTLLEIEFVGTTVTVYDEAGANAVAVYPNIRVRYETPEERTALP
jgi:hypothetical protein